MTRALIIRDATNEDIDSIYEVVSLAFQEEQNVRYGEIIQARLVKELIQDNDDVVNLVAEDSVIVGHVFVSLLLWNLTQGCLVVKYLLCLCFLNFNPKE